MRKKVIYIATLIITVLIFATNNVYANTPITPINNAYTEQNFGMICSATLNSFLMRQ